MLKRCQEGFVEKPVTDLSAHDLLQAGFCEETAKKCQVNNQSLLMYVSPFIDILDLADLFTEECNSVQKSCSKMREGMLDVATMLNDPKAFDQMADVVVVRQSRFIDDEFDLFVRGSAGDILSYLKSDPKNAYRREKALLVMKAFGNSSYSVVISDMDKHPSMIPDILLTDQCQKRLTDYGTKMKAVSVYLVLDVLEKNSPEDRLGRKYDGALIIKGMVSSWVMLDIDPQKLPAKMKHNLGVVAGNTF